MEESVFVCGGRGGRSEGGECGRRRREGASGVTDRSVRGSGKEKNVRDT